MYVFTCQSKVQIIIFVKLEENFMLKHLIAAMLYMCYCFLIKLMVKFSDQN